MTFAEKLKHLREAAGLTQAALAQASGLSLGVVRDYEQGRKEPALRSAFKLAKALGVDCTAFQDEAVLPEPARPGRPRKTEDTPPAEPAPVQAEPVADPVTRHSAATVKGQKAKPSKGKGKAAGRSKGKPADAGQADEPAGKPKGTRKRKE